MQQNIDKETIELAFKTVNLLNRDFRHADNVFLKIFLKNGEQETLLAQTDITEISPPGNRETYWPFRISNIVFASSVQVEVRFEQLQQLRIEMYERGNLNIDQLIGQTTTNVAQIVRNRTLDLRISQPKSYGTLTIIRYTNVFEQNGIQTNLMIWIGKNLLNTNFIGKSDPFLIFYKMINEKWQKILETDYVKDNLNPEWKPIEMSDDLLYNDNPQRLIKIECWDNSKSGKHNFIGEVVATQEDIFRGVVSIYYNTFSGQKLVLNNKGKTKGIGTLKLKKYTKGRIPNFVDYLLVSEKLNPIIGIDITGTHGNGQLADNPIYIKDQKLNQYQQVIEVFCDILLNYTMKGVEIFGFGGTFKGKGQNNFPLNDNDKHPLLKTDDVMQVYDRFIKQVRGEQLSGPTYVAELVRYAKEQQNKIEKEQCRWSSQEYMILLIITEGNINDLLETKQLLKECEQLPLSVVFIGIGDYDFSDMNNFFTQLNREQNNQRKIYQFEKLKDYGDSVLLIQNVLQKIPDQYLKYKQQKGRVPCNYFN